jgi:hypothetical protein
VGAQAVSLLDRYLKLTEPLLIGLARALSRDRDGKELAEFPE